MNDFKEWLSDNLRYFIVGAVVILIIGGSILGIKLYSNAVNGGNKPGEVVVEESETDTEEIKESESTAESEKESESAKESETEKESESAKETEAVKETDAEAENSAESSTSSLQTETTAPEPVPQTEAPQPETVQTEPPAPVYKTLNSACYMRSYPDYGDNIIGQYEAGTTVEFLGVVEGWYKVSVGGQTGYMGPKFFD